jgi:hypothetical protein
MTLQLLAQPEIVTTPPVELLVGNCLELLPCFPPNSVDLVFGSPPYEDARTYDIAFGLRGQEWVDFMVQVFRASLRICRGIVAFVVEGRTSDFRYTATPALLMADLHRAGIHLRKPPIFRRNGIPGSGGPDWLRNDYEYVVCATNGGKLPWSENAAMGSPPKYKPGGAPSHRKQNGERVQGNYRPPAKANPGNVIDCTTEAGHIIDCGAVGGGNMGDELCHQNEAPFPEHLAEFFIRSFCPPGGTVIDPFCGSGTVPKMAKLAGRNAIGIDVRESQIEIARRRLELASVLREIAEPVGQPSRRSILTG